MNEAQRQAEARSGNKDSCPLVTLRLGLSPPNCGPRDRRSERVSYRFPGLPGRGTWTGREGGRRTPEDAAVWSLEEAGWAPAVSVG